MGHWVLGVITEAFLYPNLDYKIIVMVTWTINAMNHMCIDQIGGYLTRLAVIVWESSVILFVPLVRMGLNRIVLF